MHELHIHSVVQVYDSILELPLDEQQLFDAASQALLGSYAPYSAFHVACAIALENGKIIIGSNQENAAFPSGLCAERVAFFHAGAQFPGVKALKMAVIAKSDTFKLTEPVLMCGSCLQVVSEYEKKAGDPLRILLSGESGEVYAASGTKTFLPFQFTLKK